MLPNTSESRAWVAERCGCSECGHLWAAVRPSPCALPLQCPACGHMAGQPLHHPTPPPAEDTPP